MFQIAGGYNLISEQPMNLDLLVGTRYLDLDTDVTVDLSALEPGRSKKFSDSGDV